MYLRAKNVLTGDRCLAQQRRSLPLGPKHAFGRPTRLADGLELESAPTRFTRICAPGNSPFLASLAANWQTSVGSPVAAIFHAALGYTWLYYTSTFATDYWQHSVVLSQVIDPAAITQNEIDVTSIDGSREYNAGIRELSSVYQGNGMRNLFVIVVTALFIHLSSVVSADTLDDIQKRGTLQWGGDDQGGGPYIYEGKDNKVTGFEVGLAEYLAKELGVRSELVTSEWNMLPQKLDRGGIDVVLNGYEWSKEREKSWSSTIPYYIYKLQLMARKDDNSIHSWDDLRSSARPLS
jgi:hypothetical protein